MNKFVLITATFGVPLLAFLVLQDAVATFYRPDKPAELAYQVVEPEEETVEEEAPEPEAEPEAEAEEEAEPVAEEQAEADAPEVDAEVEAETEVEPETAEAEAEVEVVEETTETETPAADTVQVATLSDADMAAGKKAMRKCAACHQVEKERNGVGPHLVGVMGRPIGGVEDYKYSDALMALNEAGEVWTEEAIVAWLENPAGYAPGTKMNFKVRQEEERRLIAAWLAANGG